MNKLISYILLRKFGPFYFLFICSAFTFLDMHKSFIHLAI
jgi:hypothetical protein